MRKLMTLSTTYLIRLTIFLLFTLLLSGCSSRITLEKQESNNTSSSNENSEIQTSTAREDSSFSSKKPESLIYYTDNLTALNAQNTSDFSYITKRMTIDNYFEIDENFTLWGRGRNQYGQLGQNRIEDIGNPTAHYDEPVKIAENVIHVDASEYGYFTIFITKDHKLYGTGVNRMGVLCQPVVEHEEEQPWRNPVPQPELLMENVVYASVGRESLSVLTDTGEVYWWGTFSATTATVEIDHMYSEQPRLMLQDAVYTTCGGNSAAAIGKDGRLWLWGCNVWGQCGSVGNDYEETPVCAANGIDMVWVENLTSKQSNGNLKKWQYDSSYAGTMQCAYSYTTFIRTDKGDMMACGIDLPNSQKEVSIYGNLNQYDESAQDVLNPSDYNHSYSSKFISILVEETPELKP